MAGQPPVPARDDPWSRFPLDPRAPAHSGLRASDADRDVIHQVLGEAYAQGQLDRAELDERTDAVARARTLGELTPYVQDLLPAGVPVVPSTRPDLRAQAVERYRRNRSEALWSFVSASAVCWVIWAVVMPGGFPWPLFVMLGTGLNLLRLVVSRGDAIAEEQRRLEKRERKKLSPPPDEQAPDSPPPD